MNRRVLFLLVGLVLGAALGWLTRPEAAEVKVGPLSIEVQGDRTASSRDSGELTTGQAQHVAIYAVIGAALGALAGLLAAGRRPS